MKNKNKVRVVSYPKLTILLALLAATLSAQEQDDLSALEQTLEEITEIATKTRLNADYVPGIVTVISGEKLKSLGITNLNQPNAFDIIVGMESPVSALRGAGASFGFLGNKVKWMLNGKTLENELLGLAFGTMKLSIPIDFVKQIEVLRGPNSAIYGDKAIFGTVNIVTKNSNTFFVNGGAMGGGRFATSIGAQQHFDSGVWSLDLAASVEKSDSSNLRIEKNGNFNTQWGVNVPGYAPNELPNGYQSKTFLADIVNNGYKAWLYRIETISEQGAFGQWIPSDSLPPNSSEYGTNEAYTLFGIEKTFNLSNTISITPKIGYSSFEATADYFMLPQDAPNLTSATMDGSSKIYYREVQKYGSLEATYKIGRNILSGGLFYQDTTNPKDEIFKNYNYNGTTGAISNIYTYRYPFSPLENMKKSNRACYAQDQYNPIEKLTITTGVRYDEFEDKVSGSTRALSPRLAAVYVTDDSNIFKTQYSRAFRPATFGEIGWNYPTITKLEPETVDTIELAYIHKMDNSTLKMTTFQSRTYNMVMFDAQSYILINRNSAVTTRGVEVEYNLKNPLIAVNTNLGYYKSYADAYTFLSPDDSYKPYTINGNTSVLAPSLVANIALTTTPTGLYPTTIWWHYISSKRRADDYSIVGGIPRTNLQNNNTHIPAQSFINISQKIKGVAKGLELDFGVRNILDEVQTTLYKPLYLPNQNDVPYARRSFWASATYKF